jgi:PAS domain S-box-containing protein
MMKEKNQGDIAKLQDKIRVLEAENERLSERAEDIVLLSMISEHLLEITDRKKMIEYVLEEISILKRIPYTALGNFSRLNEVGIVAQYAAFSTDDEILMQPKLTESVRKKLFETGSIVKLNLDKKTTQSLFPEFKKEDFQPVYALFMGAKLFSPLDFFLFIDDKADAPQRMETLIPVLIQIINLVVTRFENLRISDQMTHQNKWLVQEVNQKTAKLREKIEYQSKLIDHSMDGILLHKNNIIEYANPTAIGILEAKNLSALEGHSIFEFVEPDPDEKKVIENRVAQVVKNRKSIPFRETKIITAKGNRRIVEVGGIPFIDGDEIIVHLTLHDVTEKKRMERELNEERELFMGGPTVVFKWLDGTSWPIRYVSPNIFEQFGYKAEDLLSNKLNYDDLIHPDDRKRIEAELNQFKAKGIQQYEQQYRLLHADGRYRQVMDFTIYHPVSDGQSYYHGYVIDISKQVEAEKALRHSETRYRAMVEYSFEGIGLIDDHYTFTYANKNLSKIFGYPQNEIVGSDFRKFLTTESMELVSDRYRRRQAGEAVPARYEFSIRQKNGTIRLVDISTSVIKDDSGKKQSVIQLIDVTEQRTAENKLKEAHHSLQQNYQSLQAVQMINEAVRLPGDKEVLAHRAIDALSKYSGTPSVAFYVHNKAEKTLELLDAIGFPKKIVKEVSKVATSNSFSGKAVKKREVIFSTYEKKMQNQFFAVDSIAKAGFKTTLSIPLIYQEEAIGIINLLFKTIYEPSKEEQKTFLAIGRTIGMALANASHLEALEKEIIQRIKTEDQLRESEEKFRATFNNSVDSVTLSTLKEGRFIEVNQGFETITGYTRSEALGKTANELQIWPDPDDRKQVLKLILKEGFVKNYPVRFKVKDGTIITTSSSIQKIKIKNKTYLLNVSRDMTQMLEYQEALKESEEKFKAAFDNSLDAMTLTTPDGYYVDVNQGFLNTTGYRRNEVIGKSTKDLNIWEEESQRQHLIKLLNKKTAVTNFQARFRMKDGRIIDTLLSVQMIQLKGKDHLLMIARDVTELVRIQQALTENEQKFRLTFNHASDSMLLLEARGVKPPLIRDVNETTCRLHQYTKEELLGQSMRLLMANKNDPKVAQMLPLILAGEAVLFESEHIKKDGTVFPIEISAQKVTIGEKEFILSIDRDISERKAIENELRQYREELESLVQKRTEELEEVNKNLKRKNLELTRYNDVFINREFRIKELREEVRKLKKQLGNEEW